MHPMMRSVPIRARTQQGHFKMLKRNTEKSGKRQKGGLSHNKIRILKAP